MELSKETQQELEEKKRQEFIEWNNKINDIAKDLLGQMREKQLSIHDFNNIIKVMTELVNNVVTGLNINYVLNSKDELTK